MRGRVREIDTPVGTARAHLHRPPRGHPAPRGSLVLGHGAGAGVESADLQALTALADQGWTVVLLEQPWRVAGRRVAAPPATLDRGTAACLDALLRGRWALPRPLVLGGRSAGARVACRLSPGYAVAAVLLLGFPLAPPRRPERSRAGELQTPLRLGIPTLVVQGARDPFGGPQDVGDAGGPDGRRWLKVREVAGDHSPTRDLEALVAGAGRFLTLRSD